MMTTPIDTIAMVRAIRDAHYEQLKNTTPEERIAFYRERARHLHANLLTPDKNKLLYSRTNP